jgi:anthranilate phosphoribosyltransferase
MISQKGEKLYSPADLGMVAIAAESISGGETVGESARIFDSILKGKGTEAAKLRRYRQCGGSPHDRKSRIGFCTGCGKSQRLPLRTKSPQSFPNFSQSQNKHLICILIP